MLSCRFSKFKCCKIICRAQIKEQSRLSELEELSHSGVAFPFACDRSVFCSMWYYNFVDETHKVKRNLLFSNSTYLRANLIQKYSHRNIQSNISPYRYCSVKLTHKSNLLSRLCTQNTFTHMALTGASCCGEKGN